MHALEQLKSHLSPGSVYRREDFLAWSNAVDRHLHLLQEKEGLKKLSGGLYYYPKKSTFGELPPNEHQLIKAFLKDSRFLLFSYNDYNSLGLGTTQLYSESVVYNHKRHGKFKLGNKTYRFVRKHFFPEKLSQEFLVVDLLDNLKKLPENQGLVLEHLENKVKKMNLKKVKHCMNTYASARAKKYFSSFFKEQNV